MHASRGTSNAEDPFGDEEYASSRRSEIDSTNYKELTGQERQEDQYREQCYRDQRARQTKQDTEEEEDQPNAEKPRRSRKALRVLRRRAGSRNGY